MKFFRNARRKFGDPSRPSTDRAIFVLLIAIPCLVTVAFGGTDNWALLLIAPLTAFIGIKWLAGAIRSKEFRLNADNIALPLCCLLILALVQLLPFGGPHAGIDPINIPLSNALSLDPFATKIFAIRLAGYIVFIAAALTFIDTERRIKAILLATSIFGGSIAFIGILQKLASPEAIYGIRATPQAIAFGPFVNQHHFASLMVLLSGLAIAQLYSETVRRQSKLLLAIPTTIMGIAVVLTSSRGGVISYALMFTLVSLLSIRRGNRKGTSRTWAFRTAVISVLLVVTLTSVILLGGGDSLLRGFGFVNETEDLSSGRLHFWAVAFKIFASHPILGAGMDAFGVAFTQFDSRNGSMRVEQAHNDYLQLLADGGIVAFTCAVTFICLFVKKCVRALRTNEGSFQRTVVIGALGGCLGMLVHSLFDFPLRTAANAYFFLLVAALPMAISTITRPSPNVD